MSASCSCHVVCIQKFFKLSDIGITEKIEKELTMLKLSSLLSMCIRIKLVNSADKKWMLDHLHKMLISPNSHPVDIPRIMGTSRFRDPTVCKVKMNGAQSVKDVSLFSICLFLWPLFQCFFPTKTFLSD